MSKYTFLIHHQEYDDFLQRLREIGMVHIEEKASGVPEDEELGRHLDRKKKIHETQKYLRSRKMDEAKRLDSIKGDELIDRVDDLRKRLEERKSDYQVLMKKAVVLEPWGDFSWETVEKLSEVNRHLHFYVCNKSKFDKTWADKYKLFEIRRVGAMVFFVLVTEKPKAPQLDAEIVYLPKESLSDLKERSCKIQEEIKEMNRQLDDIAAGGMSILSDLDRENETHLKYREVKLQAGDILDDKLRLLVGWAPDDVKAELNKALDDEGVFYQLSAPGKTDKVPVLLKNNAFTRLFEMVGSLYSLPSYREIDLTPFFAPFFMLFFGFCLGDAGYGLLMMLGTLIMRRKAKPDLKPVWTLGMLFGVSTVIMGIFSGTFFGVMLVDVDIPWIESIKGIMLDQNQLMAFSVILGIVQIVFGICLKAARAIKIQGFKYALSTIGWVIIIVGMGGSYALNHYKILDADLARYLMIGFGALGGILTLFFNSPGKNILVNFGLGLWDTYGTVTGLLGDVLSYIRLFALGLSSAVLGSVFNQLAFNLTGDIPVLSQLFTVLILLLGHSINFFMAALGAFVHPLRLTFVEFYKNTGFEGGGKKYSPFKRV